ncbi:MAG TPA: DUF2264 domain-containing protein [Asticcacaulis sp.]|nr:DUF2264 domain-containing protein [Asticcacaulis sp.]
MDSSRRQIFALAPALAAGLAAPALAATKASDRAYWLATLDRIAKPVLTHLAAGTLKVAMPVEQKLGAGREAFSHLEAFGRTLCGIAPWLGVAGLTGTEAALQAEYRQMTLAALDKATDPQSPDFLNFAAGSQALVDTAFLAQGLLRAPGALWTPLPDRVKANVIAALKASRGSNTPDHNNWVMFAAMVEAALWTFGETPQPNRLQDNVKRMLGWYAGDGAYGDGAFFHFDYYNSLVIHPMLVDVLGVLAKRDPAFAPTLAAEMTRATRYAAVLERLIAQDGTFPSIGRSQAYRFGAFQLLGQMALLKALPDHVAPAQVRSALTAVIHRVSEAPGTFDKAGWLTIGFCGHQPAIGEDYISTGSLYMCTAAFLPLGLPSLDPFWSTPAAPWTQKKLWAGENLPADHAIADVRL